METDRTRWSAEQRFAALEREAREARDRLSALEAWSEDVNVRLERLRDELATTIRDRNAVQAELAQAREKLTAIGALL